MVKIGNPGKLSTLSKGQLLASVGRVLHLYSPTKFSGSSLYSLPNEELEGILKAAEKPEFNDAGIAKPPEPRTLRGNSEEYATNMVQYLQQFGLSLPSTTPAHTLKAIADCLEGRLEERRNGSHL
ncbi:hypothetical protein HYV83_00940 [Candidatus Woesearchaeota archaeon]|nr:hypothetical protein [Candidatus Woesearchaeota archaeon]